MPKLIESLRIMVFMSEWIAAITGFLYWHKIKNSYWKWFAFYLLFVALADTGNYIAIEVYKYKKFDEGLFTWAVIPAEFLFFIWFYSRRLKGKTAAWLCKLSYALVIAGLLADALLFSGRTDIVFMSFSYTAATIALLIVVINYFVQFTQGDEIMHWKTDPWFYVSIGLFIFYIGTFPYFGLLNTLNKHYHILYDKYTIIMFVLDQLMYYSFATAFICGRMKK